MGVAPPGDSILSEFRVAKPGARFWGGGGGPAHLVGRSATRGSPPWGAGRSPHPLLRPSTLTVGQQHPNSPPCPPIPPPLLQGSQLGSSGLLRDVFLPTNLYENAPQCPTSRAGRRGSPRPARAAGTSAAVQGSRTWEGQETCEGLYNPHHHSSSAPTQGRDLGSGHAPSLPPWLSRPLHSAAPPPAPTKACPLLCLLGLPHTRAPLLWAGHPFLPPPRKGFCTSHFSDCSWLG